MSLSSLHADARASALVPARSAQLERRLARFQPLVQPRVRALAERHPRLADLALSFPALLFAVAVPRAGFDPARAIARVIYGAPLRELAEFAHVPMWLRSIQPAAFKSALPLLPDGGGFRGQIENYLPSNPRQFDSWARAVADADEIADRSVALWLARELSRPRKTRVSHTTRGLCLWAWHSKLGSKHGVNVGSKRWSAAMQYDAAVSSAAHWLRHVEMHLNLGDEGVADAWLKPASVDGYDFVPLRTAKDLGDEAAAMRNCVVDYAASMRHDECRLWSMRRDGVRIATLEVAARGESPFPGIEQLKAVGNAIVSTELWLVARRWLDSHDPLTLIRAARRWDSVPLDGKLWTALWRPYWLAKKRIPAWLPLQPSRDALSSLTYGNRLVRRVIRRRRR